MYGAKKLCANICYFFNIHATTLSTRRATGEDVTLENCLIGLFPADLQCCWLAAENAVIKPDSLQLCVVFPVLLRKYRKELTYENVCD